MEVNTKLCAHEGKDLEDATMYRTLVGSLIYLTLTRPDISYADGVMSRYMQNPKKPHLEAKNFEICEEYTCLWPSIPESWRRQVIWFL